MSWYADLGTRTMITDGPHVRAVGWLSSGHPFPTASPSPDFLARLKQFCERWGEANDSLHWDLIMGVHTCELCGSFVAAGNIGVPAGELLYAAPEMVWHYVEAHRYAPPAEFVAAVMAAPLPGTPAYHDAVAVFREFEMRRSLPPAVSAAMSAYARLVDEKLPERIRGLYLAGSVALGDYRPGRSDIDFVAVSDTALEPSELEVLRRVHSEMRSTMPRPELDGVYLTWSALAAAPVGLSVPYCLRGQFEPSGDFAINPVTWCILHRHPVTLRGPAKPLVHHDDQMLREWCRQWLQSYWGSYVRSARRWGMDRLYSLSRELVAWGVLGVARPHATIRTGEMISKTAAGAYALDVFPSRWAEIVREALAARGGSDKSSYRNIFARRRDLLGVMEYVISDALR